MRRPPSLKEPGVRRPKAQTDRVKQRKAREEVLVVDIDDSLVAADEPWGD